MQLEIQRFEKRWGVEPISELDKIPIRECGEKLVNLKDACPGIEFEYIRSHVKKEKTMYLRERTAGMLWKARELLPKGCSFLLIDAHRPLEVQEKLYWLKFKKVKKKCPNHSYAWLRRKTNEWVAPPDSKSPPGHITGGAVDLTLIDDKGMKLDMLSPFKKKSWETNPTFSNSVSEKAMKNRLLLYNVMTSVGFSNYSQEWWHYSFGDNGWAWRMKEPYAIYETIVASRQMKL